MDGSDVRPCVLVIGLDPFRVPGPWDPAPVAAAIERGMSGLDEQGYDARRCLIPLDGSEDVEALVVDALRAESWACVLVGGGLRAVTDRPDLTETVVALVRRHAPAAAMAFNTRPDDLADAVTRSLDGVPATPPGRGVGRSGSSAAG